MPLRIVFMGTPAFSVPTLMALAEAGYDIAAVYTQPARRAGRRGLELTASPVEAEARRLGLAVVTPENFKDAADREAFAALKPDVAIVVAYGLLLPQAILDVPRHGCLNGHASLLPRWRGAAPIQRAIEAGDRSTGMMVMRMEKGLDTGPVALFEEILIGGTETAGELHDRLSRLSATLMVRALAQLEAGTLAFEDQASLAARTGREPVYARKIDKAEAEIDFTQAAEAVASRINAFSPFPGAWTTIPFGGKPERVKLLRAEAVRADPSGSISIEGEPGTAVDAALTVACGSGAVRLLELQRAGGRPLAAAELLRGTLIAAGTRLGAA
ncbi:methionyl-tRNA formyltransferase [Mangrovicella endophytica]|uniref:methionyl-tRNA formyltransferase n=1 Tax=Mangrovicella endophytica TaxID=2066697 RepID=UPI000C9E26E8|nr:methionyl-tRNA formyltransferase [Mangrovicella endophytica]